MDLESNLLYKFSEQKDNLLIASTDNKAKIFDVYAQQYQSFVLENQILNSQITCIDIKQEKNGTKIQCVFGNSKGQLILYSVDQQKKLFQLSIHTRQILDCSFDQSGQYIYTIGADKSLKKIDIKLQQEIYEKSISKRGFIDKTQILPFGEDQILYTIDNKIVLLDIQKNQETIKYTGHSQNIVLLRKSEDNNYFVSYSNEGYLNIYHKNQKTPVYTLNVLSQQSIVNIEILKLQQQKNQILICIHQTESVKLHQLKLEKQVQEKQISLNLPAPILFSTINDKNNLQIIYGSTVHMSHKQLNILNKQKQDFNNELQNNLNEILKDQKKTNSKQNQQNLQQVQKEQNKDTYILGANDYNKENENTKPSELDLEQQLEKKGILDNLNKFENETTTQNNNNVKSLAVVLLQGLHSNDQQLIDFCLEKDDEKLIENTVKKIIPNKVNILIDNISDRLLTYPRRAQILTKWLKYLVKYHSSLLISTPNIQKKLGPLLQMIDSRTKNLNKLIALRGKLDLVLQLKRNQQGIQEEEDEELKPIVVYNEGNGELIEGNLIQGDYQDDQENDISDSISDSQQIDQEGDNNEQDDDEEDEDDDEEEDIDEQFKEAQRADVQNQMEYDEEDDDEDDESDKIEF